MKFALKPLEITRAPGHGLARPTAIRLNLRALSRASSPKDALARPVGDSFFSKCKLLYGFRIIAKAISGMTLNIWQEKQTGQPWARTGHPKSPFVSLDGPIKPGHDAKGSKQFQRDLVAALVLALSAQALAIVPASAEQRCRMETQCRWVNYKKVCTTVKVCRDH